MGERLTAAIDAVRTERDEARGALVEATARHAETVAAVVAERDRAEAQLAALREAATVVADAPAHITDEDITALRRALDDTAAAAEAYERRVRAEALREAADAADGRGILTGGHFARILHARADEIEGGR